MAQVVTITVCHISTKLGRPLARDSKL